MKYPRLLALLALSLNLSISVCLLGQVQLPYSVDFETGQGFTLGPLDGQDGWIESSGDSSVSDVVAYSGTNALILETGAQAAAAKQAFQQLVGEDVIYVDFFIRPVSDSDPALGTVVDSGHSRLRFFKDGSEGRFQALDGDAVGGGTWVSVGESATLDASDRAANWQRVTFRLDLSTQTWDLYLGGVLAEFDLGTVDVSPSYLSEIVFTGHASADGYVDFGYAGPTNPLFADSDNDGMEDAWESAHGLNPSLSDRSDDLDGDGLNNIEEYYWGTEPDAADTDGDQLSDGEELSLGRDPSVAETDSFLYAIGGLRLFLKASDDVVLDTSGYVLSWGDQSGLSNNAVQGVAGYRPDWLASALGGLPVLRFDGNDDFIEFGDLMSGASEGEVFIVLAAAHDVAPSSAGDGYGLWRFGAPGAMLEGYTSFPRTSGIVIDSFGRDSPSYMSDPAFPLDQPNLYNVSSRSGEWIARFNGAVEYENLSNSPGFRADPVLGKGSSRNNKSFNGDIAELIVFDQVLSDLERSLVEQYLAQKYSLPSMLPPASAPVVQAIGVSPTRVQLSWNDLGSNLKYLVERSLDGSAWSVVAEVKGNFGYLDDSLSPSTAYQYRVTPVSAQGAGLVSDVVVAETLPANLDDIPTQGCRLWIRGDSVVYSGASIVTLIDVSDTSLPHVTTSPLIKNRPTLTVSSMNGQSAIRFDGDDDELNLPDVMSSAIAGEVFCVLRAEHDEAPASSGNGYGLWRFCASGTIYEGYTSYPRTSGNVIDSFGRSSPSYLGEPLFPLDQPNLYNVASGSGEWRARFNGSLQYERFDNSPGFRSDPTIGKGSSQNNKSFNGDIAEILIFDRVLVSSERSAVERYLGLKYDLPIPVLHPPNKPNLSVTSVSSSRIQLSWSGEMGNVRYFVDRKTGATDWEQIAEIIDKHGYLDENLSSNVEYTYRISAERAGMFSGYSEELAETTNSHTALTIPENGMRLWLRSDNAIDGAGVVRFWEDASGNGNTAIQDSLVLRPAIANNALNGMPAVRFDGEDDYLVLPDVMASASEGEVFVILQAEHDQAPASAGDGYGLWRFAASGTIYEGYASYPRTSGTVIDSFGRNAPAYTGDPPVPLDQPNLYSVSSVAGEWVASFNGERYFSETSNTPAFRPDPAIGIGSSKNNKSFNGDIAEIIIYDRKLKRSERYGLLHYFKLKYGIDLKPFALADSDPSGDFDGDGVSNADEVYVFVSDPESTDTDDDGMPDGWEAAYGLDLIEDDALSDFDGDGVSNIDEFLVGRNPSAGAIYDNSSIQLEIHYAK